MVRWTRILAGAALALTCLTAPAHAADTCAVQSKPAGKVLHGYWENWDGALNGVHPPLGWIPITDSRIRAHGYNRSTTDEDHDTTLTAT